MDPNGHEKRDAGSHAAWTLFLAAALVLYVLSIGPVAALARQKTIPAEFVPGLEKLYFPIVMLEDTPLGESLMTYITWWDKVLEKP
jgi:hypothetical protein